MSVETDLNTNSSKQNISDDLAQLIQNQHYLNPSYWQNLKQSDSLQTFAQCWLTIQCSMIAQAHYGVLLIENQAPQKNDPTSDNEIAPPSLQPLCHWPKADPEQFPFLEEVAAKLTEQKKGIIHSNERFHGLGFPLQSDTENRHTPFCGVIILVPLQKNRNSQRLKSIMRQLQWGSAWFEQFIQRQTQANLQQQQQHYELMLSVTSATLGQRSLKSALAQLATVLADQLKATRVFISWSNRGIIAISNTPSFDKRTNFLQAMAAAAQEANDQREIVIYPDEGALHKVVNRVHQTYLEQSDALSIATFPVLNPSATRTDQQVIGTISIEQSEHDYFKPSVARSIQQALTLLNPLLTLISEKERSLWQRIKDYAHLRIGDLIGPNHLLFKLSTLALIGIMTGLAMTPAPYRVSTSAQLEGWVQRSLSASIDGYILDAPRKAGHIVSKGDRLISLDDQDLLLERLKWVHQRNRVNKQYRQATVEHNRSQAAVLKAQLGQAEAQINLLDARLERLHIHAPFDGIIVSGDWSQQLGTPVNQGDTLLEIAPLNHYRIILSVDEHDIDELQLQQTGQLMLTSQPDRAIPFRIINITPVAAVTEGENQFRVEAEPIEREALPYANLRPGMRGTAKVDIGERNLLWIWTHRFVDATKLWFWSWWPYS